MRLHSERVQLPPTNAASSFTKNLHYKTNYQNQNGEDIGIITIARNLTSKQHRIQSEIASPCSEVPPMYREGSRKRKKTILSVKIVKSFFFFLNYTKSILFIVRNLVWIV